MKVFAVHMPESMLAMAFILQHVRLKFSNSSQFQATRLELQVFAPSVFLTGLRIFSVGIVINLLCTDKSGRGGNIKTYREKSPWII